MVRFAIFLCCLWAATAAAAPPGIERGDRELPPGLYARIAEIDSVMKATGDFASAADSARALLASTEATYGPRAYETGKALLLLSDALWRTDRAAEEETMAIARRAHRILSDIVGEGSFDATAALQQVAILHNIRGEPEKSLDVYRRVLASALDLFGPDDLMVAYAQNGVGNQLEALGRLDEARHAYERVVAILGTIYPEGDPRVATALNNLALVLEQLADFDAAEAMHERALAMRRAALGDAHPDVGQSLDNLAILHMITGHYGEAEAEWREALDVYERSLGSAHPEVANVSQNLALLMLDGGDFLEARRLQERALAIRRQAFGDVHLAVAQSQYNIGELLLELGDLEEAAPLLDRALVTQRDKLGESHPRVARTLLAGARLRLARGEPVEAVAAAEEARVIFAAALGDRHPEVADCTDVLGDAYLAMNEAAEAAGHFREGLAMRTGAFEGDHPAIARSLVGLARAELALGDVTASRDHVDRALVMRRTTLGSEHPLVAEASVVRATVLATLGDLDAAFAAALEAESIQVRHLRATAEGLPERQALALVAAQARGLDVALALVAEGYGSKEEIASVRAALVRSRALVLEEMAVRQQGLARLGTEADGALAERLAIARRRLAGLMLVREPEEPDAYRARVETARQEKEAAERALGERSAAFRALLVPPGESRALEAGTVLVSYARFDAGEQPGYVAFVRELDGDIAAVPVGPARVVEPLVAAWHDRAAGGESVRGLRVTHRTEDTREAGLALAEVMWAPIAPYVEGAELLLVVPDGELLRVNLDALPAADDRYLAEVLPPVHYLTCERDVARLAGRVRGLGEGILVVGSPDYDATPELEAELLASDGSADRSRTLAAYRGQELSCRAVSELRFEPLAGTEREARAVSGAWRSAGPDRDVLELLGASATERAVKTRAAGRRALHLATHGFVADGACDAPLLRSGLAFAGANRHGDSARAGENEDGILTAEEIASLDLTTLDWVVLSACETGQGQAHAGEGLIGLRRAFEIAGAGTLVTSLWPVEDEAARDWMVALYSHRLKGATTPEAVRAANLEMLRRASARGAVPSPSVWAGFVASGDWQ